MDAGTVQGALVMRDLATQVVARVEETLARLQGQLGETAKAATKAGAALDASLGKKLSAIGSSLTGAGMKLSLGLTAPLVAGAAATTKFANDFETNMTKVETLSGVAADAVADFREKILGLGGETGQGPNDLAKGLLVVTSTGIKGAEALDILKKAAQASSIGLGETKEVARALTSAMTAYGMENLSAAKAADVLFRTAMEGGAEADELAGTLGRVVGIAAQLGVSFEETGAYLATFTRLGVDASEATTSLRAVMSNMLSPTKDAQAALDSVGMTAEDLRKKVAAEGLQKTLNDLADSFRGNVTAMDAVFGNVRALAGVLGNTGKQAQAYQTVLDNIKGSHGQFDQAVARTRETAAWTWKEVKANAETTAIAFGNALAPAVGRVLEGANKLLPIVRGLAEAFSKLPGPVQTVAAGLLTIGVVAGPIMTVFGNLAKVVGFLLGSAGFGALASEIGLVTAMMARYGAAAGFSAWLKGLGAVLTPLIAKVPMLASAIGILTNPITLVVAALTAAVLAIRYFTGSWEATWRVLTLVVPPLYALEVAWKALKAGLDAGRPVFEWLVQVMKDIATVASHYLGKAWEWLVGLWSDATGKVKEFLAPLAGLRAGMSELGQALLSGVSTGLQKFLDYVLAAFPPLRMLVLAVGYVIGKGKEWADALHAEAEAIRKANAAKEASTKASAAAGAAAAKAGEQTNQAAAQAGAAGTAAKSLSQQLAAATASVNKLTAEQKANIEAGLKMGLSVSDIAGQMRISEKVVELYKAGLEDTKKAAQAAAGPVKELANKVRDLTVEWSAYLALGAQGGGMRQQWIEENADAILKTTRNATALGVALPKAFQDAAQAAAQLKLDEFSKERAAAFAESNAAAAAKIMDAEKAKARAINDGIATNLQVARDYQAKLADMTKSGTALKLTQLDREHSAALANLSNYARAHGVSYDQAKKDVDAYYRHERALATGTQDTIVERMRAAGVATRSDLLATASEAVRDYEQMKVSGEFTAEAIAAAMVSGNQKAAAAFGTTATALQNLSGFFQQLGQIAQGSLGTIISGMGQVVAQLAAARQASIDYGSVIKDSAGNVTGFKSGKWGVAGAFFKEDATAAQKWASGIQSATAVAQGAMNVWSATSSKKSAWGNAGAGALAGAQAGAAFGPYGMAIGAAAGLVAGLVRGKPDWAKAADEVGRDFGVKISDGLAKEIAELSKKKFKGDRAAASVFSIDKIIQEAGGVSSKNYSQLIGKLRDAFSMKEVGKFDAAQLKETIDKNFDQFLSVATEAAKKTGGVLDSKIREFITLDKAFGADSSKIREMVVGQLKSAADGMAQFANVGLAARTNLDAVTEEMKKLADERDKLEGKRRKGGLGVEDTARLAELNKQWEELNGKLTTYKTVAGIVAVTSQEAASGFAAMISTQYDELVAKGYTASEALAAVTPSVESLQAQLEKAGLDGGEAFASLRAKLALVKDDVAGPVLAAFAGLGQSMVGMFNSGTLTADMFSGLTGQIGQMWAKLQEAGKGGPEALALMQPQLQGLWQIWKETGWAIDEGTAKLLEQAEAAGLVGEQQKTENQKMLDGINKLTDGIGALVKGFGFDLPESMRSGADSAASSFSRLRDKIGDGINVPVVYTASGDVAGNGYQPADAPAMAKGGLVTGPTLAVVGEAGPEAVLPLDRLYAMLEGRRGGSGDVRQTIMINLDGRTLAEVTLRELKEILAVHGVGV